MLNILLIRHAQTNWNISGRFQGVTDVPLNNVGLIQAEKIAERLSYFKIDSIYSSDLSRAFNTSKVIAKRHGIHVKTSDKLREINFGEWEGKTKEEIINLGFESEYNEWKRNPHKVKFLVEGSLKNVQSRAVNYIKEILEENYDKRNIVIVSHGAVLKTIIIYLLELNLSFYKKFWLGNTSLSIIRLNNSHYNIEILNDMSHLKIRMK
jgi:broad specificity phosphatase PhoE